MELQMLFGFEASGFYKVSAPHVSELVFESPK
jgi:hypothetical protein